MNISKQIQIVASREHNVQRSLNLVPFSQLSPRELEVLHLIVEGQSNPAIAATLHLSKNTVKTHVRNIMNKLGADCRIKIAVIALRLGLI